MKRLWLLLFILTFSLASSHIMQEQTSEELRSTVFLCLDFECDESNTDDNSDSSSEELEDYAYFPVSESISLNLEINHYPPFIINFFQIFLSPDLRPPKFA